MKIIKLETFHVKPRWLILKISTDEGIVGFGEPVIEGKSKIVEAAVQSIGKAIIGKDPRDIERLWQFMYRGSFYRGGPIMVSAISGIEQALWDIKGKYYGMPVYEMLGGKVRDKIRVYPHIDGEYPAGDSSTERWVELALKRKEQGFNFIKFGLPDIPVKFLVSPSELEEYVDKFRKIREAVGNDMDLAVDCHGRLSPATAIRLCKALEPYRPAFVEEPVLPENVDALVKVKEATSIPIAAGERLFTKWAFRELVEKQAVAIVQPDCCHAGGILEVKKIATLAETYYGGVAPHNPLGPISLAACLQVDACTPNFVIQEFPCMDNGWDRGVDYLTEPFKVNDGFIDVPTKPGLGIEVNEDFLKENEYDGEWANPIVFDPDDSSIRDW